MSGCDARSISGSRVLVLIAARSDKRTFAKVTNVTSEKSNPILLLLDAGTSIKSLAASAPKFNRKKDW